MKVKNIPSYTQYLYLCVTGMSHALTHLYTLCRYVHIIHISLPYSLPCYIPTYLLSCVNEKWQRNYFYFFTIYVHNMLNQIRTPFILYLFTFRFDFNIRICIYYTCVTTKTYTCIYDLHTNRYRENWRKKGPLVTYQFN